MSKKEIWLRSIAGFSLVAMAIGFGVSGSAILIIFPLAFVFSVSYFFDKWTLWKQAFQASTKYQLIVKVLSTVIVQFVVCAFLYVVGRGVGSLFGIDRRDSVQDSEFVIMVATLVVSISLAYWVKKIVKQNNKIPEPIVDLPSQGPVWRMVFDPNPISVENFYTSFRYGQPEDLRFPSEEKIQEMERKLGIKFPNLLKELYRKQNGGSCPNLWVPAKEDPSDLLDDWRGVFSHDYCYLCPLEKLQTVHDSYLNFMDEDEIEQDPQVPKDAKKYIILCQRYLDTTFLDYSQPGEPRVGIVDFDGIEKKNVWFENFEEFFKNLRRADIEES